jgi:hypothetical protein
MRSNCIILVYYKKTLTHPHHWYRFDKVYQKPSVLESAGAAPRATQITIPQLLEPTKKDLLHYTNAAICFPH